MCDKNLDEYPDWKWVVIKKSGKITADLFKEAWKRDQDAHDEYHYNDFTGDGQQEVMNNEVSKQTYAEDTA